MRYWVTVYVGWLCTVSCFEWLDVNVYLYRLCCSVSLCAVMPCWVDDVTKVAGKQMLHVTVCIVASSHSTLV